MDLVKIGKYIAGKRKDLGMTQKQLAEKLGMSDKSVSKWERGVCLPDVSVYSELCQILGISINEFLAGEDIVRENIAKKSEETIIGLATDSKQKQKRLKYIIGILLVTAAIVVLTVGIMIFRKNMPQNFIVPVDKDSIEMKTAEMLSGVDGAFMYKYTATNEFKTLYIHIWQYREGKLVDRQRAGLSYEGMDSPQNGTIIIVPQFKDRTVKIIIADDASTDSTPQIATELAKTHENVLFLPLSTSLGPGGARNKALQQASGEYISFIDSDDWMDLNYLEVMYNKAQQLNADIVTCSLMREYDYITTSPVYKCKYDQDYVLSGEIAFRIMTNEYNYGIKFLPSALNKIYRKTFLTDNLLTFPEHIFFEDQPFSYSCTLAANRVVCVPQVVYHHYKRSGSIVQSFNQKNIDDMMTAYKMIKEYLQKNNIYKKFRFNYYSSFL